MKILFIIMILFVSFVLSDQFYYDRGKKIYLKVVNESQSNIRLLQDTTTYYTNSAGIKLGVDDTLIITLKNNKSIESLLDKYNLVLIQALSNTIYLVQVKDNAKIFEISNKLYHEINVQSAIPNFTKKIKLR